MANAYLPVFAFEIILLAIAFVAVLPMTRWARRGDPLVPKAAKMERLGTET